tara:strand:+ start:374 stop:547 length:174 start_codon:yes stop_codon:yes gene_type:complete
MKKWFTDQLDVFNELVFERLDLPGKIICVGTIVMALAVFALFFCGVVWVILEVGRIP